MGQLVSQERFTYWIFKPISLENRILDLQILKQTKWSAYFISTIYYDKLLT